MLMLHSYKNFINYISFFVCSDQNPLILKSLNKLNTYLKQFNCKFINFNKFLVCAIKIDFDAMNYLVWNGLK